MTPKNNPFYILSSQTKMTILLKNLCKITKDINSKEERKTNPKILLPNTGVIRSGKYLFQNSTTNEQNFT